MAATLYDSTYLSSSAIYRRRIESAVIKAALAIAAEKPDSTEHSRLRRALATQVLQTPHLWTDNFALPVAINPVITDSSSDNDLEYTVASVWDAIAGAGQAG